MRVKLRSETDKNEELKGALEEAQIINENLVLRCNMMESTDPDLAMKIKEARDEEMMCAHPEKPKAIPSLDLDAVMEK